MKILYGARRCGKTTELIRRAHGRNTYIVCMSQEEASRVFRQAMDMGLNIAYPLTFDELEQGRFHPPGVKSLMMDNADYFLKRYMDRVSKGCEWEVITVSNDVFSNSVEKL